LGQRGQDKTDLPQWARLGSAVRQRFETGEALEAAASDLGVPPDALRAIYDEYVVENLEEGIRARPCFQQLHRHRRIGDALQVLAGNSAELLDLIRAYQSGDFHVGLGMLRDQDRFFATIGLRLHNYVAAAMTVVYHLNKIAESSAFRTKHPKEY